MMYGGDAYGSASYGEAGTAAGTSSAAAAGAAFTATVRTGRVVVVGQAVEINETMAAGKADVTPPPAAAERLLRWVLPLKLQEPILGDLTELYADTCATFGAREARRLYWWHAIRSIVPVVMCWSIVATALEWLRRWLGS